MRRRSFSDPKAVVEHPAPVVAVFCSARDVDPNAKTVATIFLKSGEIHREFSLVCC